MHNSAPIEAPAWMLAPAPSWTRPLPKFEMRPPRVGSLIRTKGAPLLRFESGQSAARLVTAASAPVFMVLPKP